LNDQQVINSLLLSKEMEMHKAGEIARLADGDYHLAEELSEQLSGNDTFDKAFLSWMRLCFNPAKNMEALMAWVDNMATYKREEQKQFLYASIQMVRECMMVNLADASLVKLEDQQVKSLEKFLPFVNAKNMTPFVEELSKAHFHIERNAHAKILFLDLSLKLGNILQIKA
jgi:DNA polymerase-3 subunit delta'